MVDTFAVAITFALLNSVFFGFSKILYRKGMVNIPVQLAIFYTLLPAAPILLVATIIIGEFAWLSVTPYTLILIPVTALVNFNLGRLFLFEAIRNLGAARASQLISLSLIFASIFGVLLMGETMTIYIASGTIVIFAAISLLLLSPADMRLKPLGYNLKRGVLMGGIGSLVWGFSFIASKLMLLEFPPLSASWLIVLGAIGIQALLASPSFRSAKTLVPDRRSMAYFVLSGIVTSIAFLAYMLAVNLAPIVLIAPFASLSPIFAALWSYLLIQRLEFVGIKILVASIMVAIGSYIIAL